MIKKVWISEWNKDLVSLSLESVNPEQKYNRIHCKESVFPVIPTEQHPLRHTVSLGLFDKDDINKLAQLLDNYRTDK